MATHRTLFGYILKYILIMCLSTYCYAANYGEAHLWEQHPLGMNNSADSYKISDYEFQDMCNVFTDEDNGVVICPGVDEVWITTGAVRFMKEYTKITGDRYLVFVASNTLCTTKTPGIYTIQVSTISLTSVFWEYQYNGVIYTGSDKDDAWYFDGTTLYLSTITPQSKYAIMAYNRGIHANISNTGQGSKVSYSDLARDDINNFPGAYYAYVNKDDGEEITGLIQYQDQTLAFKPHSIHKIIGLETDTNVDDDVIPISNEIGCIGGAIRELNGMLYFWSEEGLVEFNGTIYTIISEAKVSGTVDNMKELSSSTQYWEQTTAADWGAGTPDVFCDTTSIDGSYKVFVSTSKCKGNLYPNQRNIVVDTSYNAGNTGGVIKNWQTFKTTVTCVLENVSLLLRTDSAVNPTPVICIRGGDITSGTTTWGAFLTPSANAAWLDTPMSEYNIVLTSGVTYELGLRDLHPFSAGNVYWSKNNSNTYPYGNAYVNEVSSTTCDFAFQINVTPARCEYISQSKQAQSSGETWGQWEKIVLNGNDTGNIDIYTRTSGLSGTLSSQEWIKTNNNTSIVSSTGPFVQFYTILKSTSAKVDDVTIGYFASGNPDTLQTYPDIRNNRLYTTYTEIGQTSNNKMLVYQGNNKSFTQICDLGISYITDYKYDTYMGGTNGLIYLWSDDYTDFNGTDKAPYIKTKDYDFGNRLSDKLLNAWYYNGAPSTLYTSATVDFHIDLSTGTRNSVSVPLNTNNPLYVDKPILHKIQKDVGRFKYINFKISDFEIFNGADIYYEILERD